MLAVFRLRLCYIVYPEKKKENVISSYLGPCVVMLLEYEFAYRKRIVSFETWNDL